MAGFSEISEVEFYFGLQTEVKDPRTGRSRGKGLIFSRWKTRDLENARIAEGGWTESSGHEGDFIGIRRLYDWKKGDYRLRLAPEVQDSEGEWFGLWITNLDTDATTWIGSLRFPYNEHGETWILPRLYSTIEIHGTGTIRPIEIPEIAVTVSGPLADGNPPSSACPGYSHKRGEIRNSEVRYDPESWTTYLKAGGTTQRETNYFYCKVVDRPVYSLQGSVTDMEGRPLTVATGLTFYDGTHQIWVPISNQGTFKTRLPSGSYAIKVYVFEGDTYEFVGWVNGNGVTTEPNEGLKVEVVWPTKDIEVTLPGDVGSLLCTEGGSRSPLTGECS